MLLPPPQLALQVEASWLRAPELLPRPHFACCSP